MSMTEHAGYVWPSYGIAALVLIGLVVLSLRAFRKSRDELERLEAQMPGKSDEA
ncbi:MAG: heme exporter protein CcmD [Rhodospirillales bacterium]|nr:heme exporter protein CcmD [Rhodospirillales bacterium]